MKLIDTYPNQKTDTIQSRNYSVVQVYVSSRSERMSSPSGNFRRSTSDYKLSPCRVCETYFYFKKSQLKCQPYTFKSTCNCLPRKLNVICYIPSDLKPFYVQYFNTKDGGSHLQTVKKKI
ncbi:hypothetical protein L798_12658 [Zootermopsis nevadensis]|uniref:Uncharacterized protein n=1 Tax=Zootermopsis nevadensis TaxID=136037 RepID=A0A067R4X0_ZOONE|nr:hypothetical protein L798_12658 [Zootermopsis nevadensis]